MKGYGCSSVNECLSSKHKVLGFVLNFGMKGRRIKHPLLFLNHGSTHIVLGSTFTEQVQCLPWKGSGCMRLCSLHAAGLIIRGSSQRWWKMASTGAREWNWTVLHFLLAFLGCVKRSDMQFKQFYDKCHIKNQIAFMDFSGQFPKSAIFHLVRFAEFALYDKLAPLCPVVRKILHNR